MVFDLEAKRLDITRDAAMCQFIPEDLALMAGFLTKCKQFIDGEIDETQLEDIDV